MHTIVVLLQNDLRLRDNPALCEAVNDGDSVIPLFVWDPERYGDHKPGRGQRWWIQQSLQSLRKDLEHSEASLVIREGETDRQLFNIIAQTNADAVYWNDRHRPPLDAAAAETAAAVRQDGLRVETFDGPLMHDPEAVQTTSGGPYHVFTPFWNKFIDVVDVVKPRGAPDFSAVQFPDELSPGPDASELRGFDTQADPYDGWWVPSESAAQDRMSSVTDHLLDDYHRSRDRPDRDGTSRLSPYLRSGQISARQVWHRIIDAFELGDKHLAAGEPEGPVSFLQELVWREFAHHLLHHYPETTGEPLRDKFRRFEWRNDPRQLRLWQRGETGYPIVDAGMRQLHRHGWMHNRVRMVVASFLTKDLLITWQRGAEHFWDLLVDADLANNTLGWQWAAGCGADAQPFFRIFNPVSQAEKHDPEGNYIRSYVPEIADLPTPALYAPWQADDATLSKHGIDLGSDYPEPIVDHSDARERALEEYNRIK